MRILLPRLSGSPVPRLFPALAGTLLVLCALCVFAVKPARAAEDSGYFWSSPSHDVRSMRCLNIYVKAAADGSVTEFDIPCNDVTGLLVRGEIHFGPYTGTHDGADDAATLTDSTAHWETSELSSYSGGALTISNSTDSSTATVTANTHTTVSGTLAGGTGNDWDDGDGYSVGPTAAPTTSTSDILIKDWLGVEIFGDTTLDNLTPSADCDVEPDIAYRYTTGPFTVDMTGNSVSGGGFFMKIYFMER